MSALATIRERVTERLQAAGFADVQRTRWVPNLEEDVFMAPVTTVYTIRGSASHDDTSPRVYTHRPELIVEFVDTPRGVDVTGPYEGQGAVRLDDLMDTRGENAVIALITDPLLTGQNDEAIAADLEYRGYEDDAVVTSKITLVSRRLRFDLTYLTDLPEGDLEDFALARVDWNLTDPDDTRGDLGPDGPVDAQDKIELETT